MKTGIAAILLPLLCAVHCVATPLMITVAPTVAGNLFTNPLLEGGLLVFGLLAGVFTVGADTLRIHRKWQIPLVWLAGFALLALADTFQDGGFYLAIVSGASLIAWAVWKNRSFSVACACAHA